MHVSGFEGFSGILNQNVVGAQAGLGIETLVTPNVAIRAEASYTGATQALTLNSGSDRYSPSILQLQLGAEYKFDAPGGWGARAAAPVFSGAAPPTWTGVEIGGFVSVNGNQETYNDTNQGQTGPFARFAVGGGAFVDANYEIAQRYVVGAEFSGNYDHAKFVNAAGTNGYYGPLFDFGTVESVWALTGRVGWLASPGTLFYVKGGAAWVDTTTDFGYWNNVAPNGSGNKMLPGYQVGIGAETFVTQNVSVRVEALYTGITRRIDLNGSINANEFALEPSILSATTGVAYHF
jgi:outer membrane immunogenic protein